MSEEMTPKFKILNFFAYYCANTIDLYKYQLSSGDFNFHYKMRYAHYQKVVKNIRALVKVENLSYLYSK